MPSYVVERVAAALNEHSKSVKGSSILVYGVAYKKNVNDVRESPAFEVMEELEKKGARVAFTDPLVPSVELPSGEHKGVDPDFGAYDAVVVITDHDGLDRERLAREARIVIDTRDSLAGIKGLDPTRIFGL